VVTEPDYEAELSLRGVRPQFQAGVYDMVLTATTASGSFRIEDAFEVRDAVPFDVERSAPTRIVPTEPYTVTMTIRANEAFSGEIVERVPAQFAVGEQSSSSEARAAGVTNALAGGVREVIWDADVAQGETVTLSYVFDAPDISPEFWLLGPLSFYDGVPELPETSAPASALNQEEGVAEDAEDEDEADEGDETEEVSDIEEASADEVSLEELLPPPSTPPSPSRGSLRFAEVRQWQIAGDVIYGYIEKFDSWTATTSLGWEDQDLAGSPWNVPANAVIEVALINTETGAENDMGVRANGSSLNRFVRLQEAEAGGMDVGVMHVQVDANSVIEHYTADSANTQFILLGYWTGGTYVEKFQTFSAGASTAWTDHDLDPTVSARVRPRRLC
jgi:hypothetical protein